MKKSKFTEAQIVFALKQSEQGVTVEEICRKMGISEATFYNWKKKYGGLGVSELRELRMLKEENSRLKKMVADLSLDKQMLQDVIKKSSEDRAKKGTCRGTSAELQGLNAAMLSLGDGTPLRLLLQATSP
jgi:putative transposase